MDKMNNYQRIYAGLLLAGFLVGAMYSLVTSLFTATFDDWSDPGYWVRVILGAWILVYFVVPWLLMQNTKANYKLGAFLIDCLDLVLIVVSIVFLGFVSSKIAPNLAVVYPCIAAIPVLSWWGNRVCPRTNRGPRWHVSILVFIIGLGIPILGLEHMILVNIISIIVLSAALAFYLWIISREMQQQ